MIDNLPYDKYLPKSIEDYSKLLEHKTFREVLPNNFKNFKGKGGLGQLLEKYHFLYEPNSNKDPDFKEAGVELKVSPFKVKKNKTISAKERIALNIINYMEIVNETFENSTFLHKNRLLLLVFYQYIKGLDKLDYQIVYTQLFTYPEEDLKIIKDDWEKIMNKIMEGKAHDLSESDTFYLGASTKGKNKSSLREQPNCEEDAMQRAFSLKTKYVTHILNKYILTKKESYEPIIKDIQQLSNKRFDEYIIDTINLHSGISIDELALKYSIKNSNSKNFASQVALKMLGVKSKNASEFEKANVKVKSIRIENNGKNQQHMSFPIFKFKELIKEEWEKSDLRTLFAETKFLFVIFRYDKNNILRLDKGMFWNMPISDLEGEVKKVWKRTVKVINEGVVIEKKKNKNYNNLPNPSESPILHVRPHANKDKTFPLPDGRELTKQSFWLRNTYILDQIRKGD